MSKERRADTTDPQIQQFLRGKSELTLSLFHHFIARFETVGDLTIEPAKTMIGISNAHHRIAWITQLGKNFVHVVFPFKGPHEDNLCFQKIAQVPGSINQFNHHLRIHTLEDVNEELMEFMKLAYQN